MRSDIRSPQDIGLPSKFQTWREGQEDAINAFMSTDHHTTAVVQPTGSGKSASYITAALESGRKTVVLTSTKALQDQIVGDFGAFSLVDIRGQSSFTCALDPAHTVRDAICRTANYSCHLRKMKGEGPECEYFQRLFQAKSAQIIVTNYYWWFSYLKWMTGTAWNIDDIEVVVMDEAHDAIALLNAFLQIRVDPKHLSKIAGMDTPAISEGVDKWRLWALIALPIVQVKLLKAQEKVADMDHSSFNPTHTNRLLDLFRTEQQITDMTVMRGDWAIQEERGKEAKSSTVILDPIEPGEDTLDRYLMGPVKHRYLTSATLCRHSVEMFSVKDYGYLETGSTFSVERRPVRHVRTIRVDYKTPESDLIGVWVKKIDHILSQRRDRKGIVHTISYDRAKLLVQHSEYKELMFLNKPWNLTEVVEAFKDTHIPAILVSPSVGTGYDFPYEECQYQIIGKIPFPNTSDPALKARSKKDPLLPHYMAMQQMVQMSGRGMRAEDDFCEVFIVDDHMEWWYKKHKKLAPKWFHESIKLGLLVVPRPRYRLNGSVLPVITEGEEEFTYV